MCLFVCFVCLFGWFCLFVCLFGCFFCFFVFFCFTLVLFLFVLFRLSSLKQRRCTVIKYVRCWYVSATSTHRYDLISLTKRGPWISSSTKAGRKRLTYLVMNTCNYLNSGLIFAFWIFLGKLKKSCQTKNGYTYI